MGVVLSGSYLEPVPTHHVPEITVMKRSLGWKWGWLMWCGCHLVRTIYRPGLAGSPASIAWLAPPALSVHWILSGRVYERTFGSGAAAFTETSPNKTLA